MTTRGPVLQLQPDSDENLWCQSRKSWIMVTHNATMLEQHLLVAGESPLNTTQRNRRRFLNKEDPMSHRIIEKRRRDRMNNCLADLSRLIPADYLKKGRGRIEKTEIIEMAIKHMKHLQSLACPQLENCDLVPEHTQPGPIVLEHYRLGYQECLSETMHFMVEVEGYFAGDPLCVQLINHLQKHCDKILKGDRINFPRTNVAETTSTSSGSSGGYGHHSRPIGASSGLGSSSSPGSGSGCSSDSGNKDTPSEMLTQRQTVAPVPGITVEDREAVRCSQLRDMLQQHPSATVSSSASMPSVDQSSAPPLYKFKNNIKQRFTAEHDASSVIPLSEVCNGSSAKRARYMSEMSEETGGSASNILGLPILTADAKRRDSETCSVPSSPPSPKYNPPMSPVTDLTSRVTPPLPPQPSQPRHKSHIPHSRGIPIFALHSKGSFYIPLTLEAEVLAPYLAAIGVDTDMENSHDISLKSIVLHPVTISVNFQQAQNNIKMHHMNSCSSSIPWKIDSNGFSSTVSKWPVCVQDRG
ncbi:transcription factor cwo isoform X2 [Schistocerca gregaria]|uniref:transcription factor cwo isoform X2 n=1 Tax=Schistocerca gregaria TaxID=7010 RepID=UPI00211E068E|nr:transcription factor cwo isoform X2 [Schistocerca gregaria]